MLDRPLLSAPRGSAASDHLDMMRGLAAVVVLVGHARHLFFVGSDDIAHFSTPLRAFYFLSSFGHQAVIFFFVLSGFFVGSSVLRAWQSQRWSWSAYLRTRLTRLYIVLLPALIMGFFWDRLGMSFGHPETYFRELQDFGLIVSHRSTIPAFLGSLFFVQEIATPSFGSNGALWSLASEFWCYMLFPLTMMASFGRTVRGRIFTGLVIGTIFFFIGKGVALYGIWLLGVAVALAPFRVPSLLNRYRTIAVPASLAVVGAATTVTRFAVHGANFVFDFGVGLSVAILLYVLLNTTAASFGRAYSAVAQRLAGCSYTVYLSHLPLLYFARSLVIGDVRWQPDVYHLGLWAGILFIVSAYVWIFYRLTERQTDRVRNRLEIFLKSMAATCTGPRPADEPVTGYSGSI